MQYVLVVDIGTGGVHASLVDPTGKLSANAYEEIAYHYDQSINGLEFDASFLVDAVKRQIKNSLAKSAARPENIKAIAFTSQRHGCVFLDKDDNPVGAFPNLDPRSDKLAAEVAAVHGNEVFDITGRWPACWFPALRFLWFKKNRPETFAKFASLMLLNEYVVFRLTGARVSEWTNATESMFFDIHRQCWSDRLRTIFGAESLRLNNIVPIGSVADKLLPDIASDLGLKEVPVVMAAADTQSAVFGCGDIKPGEVVIVNGSTTPLFMPTGKFMTDSERRVCTDAYYSGNWALEGNCYHSGLTHRKLMDQLLALVNRLPGMGSIKRETLYDLFSNPDTDPKGICMQWGPVISNISKKPQQFRLALSAANDECNIFMSIIPALVENIAFAVHENAKLLSSIIGFESDRMYLTGGGSANKRLQRALTALNPDKDILLMNDLETTSRGAAMHAWIAIGEYHSAQEAFEKADTDSWHTALPKNNDDSIVERHAQWLKEYTI